MPDNHSLLAHLVPKLTRGVEDAATDALAFILNKSEPCRAALVELVSGGDRQLMPVENAKTQVSPSDSKERLDLVAYDSAGLMRLIIESKFWAVLRDGQACGYVRHLSSDGPAMLLFVAPNARLDTLWVKIERQLKGALDLELGPARAVGKMTVVDVADVPGAKKFVALMSWDTLLKGLDHADPSMNANVRQLHGLALAQDEVAFTPLHAADLDATIARRIMGFNRIVNGVVRRGTSDGWMTIKGMRAAPKADGHMRFVGFDHADGRGPIGLALCVSLSHWAERGTTPLWLRIWHKQPIDLEALSDRLAKAGWLPAWREPEWLWVPIELPMGVEYDDALDSAAEQVERVFDIAAQLVRPLTSVAKSPSPQK
ncbi:hypothetical protein [Candidatus Poriferisodalis sp.]|uniref:hypothetical protein n=1 Tax=Candidatus Poriferisodalis sp. TaxID=3101277 RepID=UPI003B527B19